VEAFQGLESQLVTISTTRVRCHFFELDKLRGIGIIGQEKKFNVAITGADQGS